MKIFLPVVDIICYLSTFCLHIIVSNKPLFFHFAENNKQDTGVDIPKGVKDKYKVLPLSITIATVETKPNFFNIVVNL